MTATAATVFSPPALSVFHTHYYARNAKGERTEASPSDVFERVRQFYVEAGVPAGAAQEMQELQEQKLFSFNSPVYYNAGSKRPQLLACFVSNLSDSMDSIITHVGRGMRIFKSGAGMGFNIGQLRPRGAALGDGDTVGNAVGGRTFVGKDGSSGPLSYMEIFQSTGSVVMSAGRRRAAMWAGMRVDHPDIESFITCKRTAESRSKYTNMNISMLVTDDFFRAVQQDEEIPLVWADREWKRVRASELLRQAAISCHAGGDPGLMFVDEVNRHNTTPSYGLVICTNPCGEICLPPDTSCNLGAVVLNHVVRWIARRMGMTNGGWVPYDTKFQHQFRAVLGGIAHVAMEHLDVNMTVNHYPDEGFAKNTKEIRPTGLGISGLGEALYALGLPYGSDKAIHFGALAMSTLTRNAIDWGTQQEPCEASDNPENRAAFVAQMEHYIEESQRYELPGEETGAWEELTQRIEQGAPIRNMYHTCIAPTGNTGIAFDSGSGGCEPVIALSYQRNTRDGVLDFSGDPEFLRHAKPSKDVLERIRDNKGSIAGMEEFAPSTRDVFVVAGDLDWRKRLKTQEALQAFTSLSISSTLNLPNDTPPETILDIYHEAFRSRLKGVTVYRDGSVQFAPVTLTKDTKSALPDTMPAVEAQALAAPMVDSNDDRPSTARDKAVAAAETQEMTLPDGPGSDTEHGEIVTRRVFRRPDVVNGRSFKFRLSGPGGVIETFYITINEVPDLKRPLEVFINGGRSGETVPALIQALGRQISGWLQDGAPVRKIVKHLIGIRGDVQGRARILPGDKPILVTSVPDAVGRLLHRLYLQDAAKPAQEVAGGQFCPQCMNSTLVASEGCWKCMDPGCAYSAC